MLDPRYITENQDAIRACYEKRGASEEALNAPAVLESLNHRRGELLRESEQCRALRNQLSPQIGQLMKAGKREEADALKAQVKNAAINIKTLEEELNALELERNHLLMRIPNILDERVPEGASESDNQQIRSWGDIPTFEFTPLEHDELGRRLGIIDAEAGAKISGARFTVLRGAGARLERALIQFFLNLHTQEHGYEEVMVPYMVRRNVLEGTSNLPKFEDDLFKLSKPLNGQDGFLIPTAEVPVTNLHREEILSEEQLPLSYTCFTPCFRSEAGAYGKDTRGLIRQHQFHKVELVRITTPEQADENHELLCQHAERCLQLLKLPYRVMRLCSGDISFGAKHCYDLEVWLPGQNAFREISSCSNFGDFQARRMKTRYRPVTENKKTKPIFCHTINGSGLAVGRTLVAIIENYQRADGSIEVPEVLRPYMNGLDQIQPLN